MFQRYSSGHGGPPWLWTSETYKTHQKLSQTVVCQQIAKVRFLDTKNLPKLSHGDRISNKDLLNNEMVDTFSAEFYQTFQD